MDISNTISANLTKWMDNTPGLDTIQKLEKESQVGFGTIRRARKGEGNITVANLAAIAAAFKRHPAELLINEANLDRSADAAITLLTANEPPTPPLTFQTPRQRNIDQIQALLSNINDAGIVAILEFTKHVTREQPHDTSQTQS